MAESIVWAVMVGKTSCVWKKGIETLLEAFGMEDRLLQARRFENMKTTKYLPNDWKTSFVEWTRL